MHVVVYYNFTRVNCTAIFTVQVKPGEAGELAFGQCGGPGIEESEGEKDSTGRPSPSGAVNTSI
jgi:hypothetical protein